MYNKYPYNNNTKRYMGNIHTIERIVPVDVYVENSTKTGSGMDVVSTHIPLQKERSVDLPRFAEDVGVQRNMTDDHTADSPMPVLEIIQEESEEEEEVCNVCLDPLDSFPDYTTTLCNHTFCNGCIQKLFKHHFYPTFIHCPTCRNPVSSRVLVRIARPECMNMPPLSEFYIEHDFSWIIQDYNREIIESAYRCITRLHKWKFMQEFEPRQDEGFMGCSHPTVVDIMTNINDEYGLHSGASLGYAMRTMQKIARIGLEEFKRDYLENISS